MATRRTSVTETPLGGGKKGVPSPTSAAAAPSPVLGNIPPGDGMPVGPVPPGFFQFKAAFTNQWKQGKKCCGATGRIRKEVPKGKGGPAAMSVMRKKMQPFMSPRYPGGPRPPLRIPNQALGGVPGSQPLLPSGMDPTRQQGKVYYWKIKNLIQIFLVHCLQLPVYSAVGMMVLKGVLPVTQEVGCSYHFFTGIS
ncbi:Single-stranded DNA-binding protein 2 [Varanus komodoensis]|nr:Single-stranded DNA-binding protein 2 [Varanus komodoensis]